MEFSCSRREDDRVRAKKKFTSRATGDSFSRLLHMILLRPRTLDLYEPWRIQKAVILGPGEGLKTQTGCLGSSPQRMRSVHAVIAYRPPHPAGFFENKALSRKTRFLAKKTKHLEWKEKRKRALLGPKSAQFHPKRAQIRGVAVEFQPKNPAGAIEESTQSGRET